jgi:hypothetical protein
MVCTTYFVIQRRHITPQRVDMVLMYFSQNTAGLCLLINQFIDSTNLRILFRLMQKCILSQGHRRQETDTTDYVSSHNNERKSVHQTTHIGR